MPPRSRSRSAGPDLLGFGLQPSAAPGTASSAPVSQQALRLSEEKYRLLLESISDVVFTIDAGGVIRTISPVAERLFQYPSTELVGKSMAEFICPEDLPGVVESLQRTLGGQLEPWEFRVLDKRGEVHYVRTFSHPFFDQGRPSGLSGLLTDITQVKQAEMELRASESKYRLTLDSMGDSIHVIDRELRILLINPAFVKWCRLLGLDIRDAVGRSVPEVFPFLPPSVIVEYQQVLDHGKTLITEETTLLGSNRIITETRKIPIWEQDRVTHVVTVVRDITRERRVQEEKRLLETQLQQAQKMEAIGRLAGGLAHDFNNLLLVILNYARFIKERSRPGDPNMAEADEIEKAANRGAALTRRMLAISRNDPTNPRSLQVNTLVEDLVVMLRRLLGKNIRLTTSFAPDLGAIFLDNGHFEQVLMNLVINARDSMPNGGNLAIATSNLEVGPEDQGRVPGLDPGRYVVLEVSDTGNGMTREIQEHIFEPFFTTKKPGEGTGLGLAIVYGIVTRAEGHIQVLSEPGRGSTFRVFFPHLTPGDLPLDLPAPTKSG